MPIQRKQRQIKMPELSPLAKKYKDALDGHMIVFDMDGTGKDTQITCRYSLVVLARHACEQPHQEEWSWIQRQVGLRIWIKGSCGNKFDFYEDIREILIALHDAEIPIALASSTWDPSL